ncbi:hypothetical protein DYB37_007568 [Aphanomyces astaci]|uniref:MI domain-containing protein n=1 Tax=Aphanomyces astaci TaxID=112090 RepID=A0A418EEP8_APHAT|nr:hypothetical protein DYB37_007568 [Aphanomyces astaci]
MVDTTTSTTPSPPLPKTKLRASAPAFVFSANAPTWQPPSYTAPAPPAPVVAVAAAVPILKPTAKAFVPSCTCLIYIPCRFSCLDLVLATPAVVPSTTEVHTAIVVEPTKEPEEPAVIPAAAAAAVVVAAPVAIVVVEEEEDAAATPPPTTTVAVIEPGVPTTPVGSTKPEPEAESHPSSPISSIAHASPDYSATIIIKDEEPSKPSDGTAALLPSPTSRKRRITYTLAEMLLMEPEACPVPAGLELCVAPPGESKASRLAFKQAKPDTHHHRSNDRSNDRKHKGGKKNHKHSHHNGYSKSNSNIADEDDLTPVKPLSINEETRWKPKDHAVATSSEATTDAHLAQVQAILNKLSVEKFERLSDQLIAVAVKSADVLRGAIDMVVKKAQMEWHFSSMYAQLCAKMARSAMPLLSNDDSSNKEEATSGAKLFRSLLLTRCQKEFEVSPLSAAAITATNHSDQVADELAVQSPDTLLLLKRATLGHIRFIGELFKQGMLSARIMHECIQRLFGNTDKPDEESLECMCKLLATVGLRLEERAAAVPMEAALIKQYYDIIYSLSQDKTKLCTRVRFMLQDLIDMRANKYVSRLKEAKATTIAEVHAQAAREEKLKTSGHRHVEKPKFFKSQSLALPPPSSAAASQTTNRQASKDGWETVPAKVKLVKSVSADIRPQQPQHPSRFSDKRNDSDNRGKPIKSRRGSVERRSSVDTPQSASRRPPAVPRGTSVRHPSPEPPVAAASRSEDELVKVAKRMFKEFVAEQDLAEVQAQLHDVLEHTQAVTLTIWNFALDQKDAERNAVGPFFAGLAANGLVDAAGMAAALAELIEFLEDIEIDIPKAGLYLSQMIAPLLAQGVWTLDQVDLSVLPDAKQSAINKHLASALGQLDNAIDHDVALVEFMNSHK